MSQTSCAFWHSCEKISYKNCWKRIWKWLAPPVGSHSSRLRTMESSNLQMLLDAAAWLNDTRAPNDIDCTGTTQSVDASISRLEEFHSVGKTKTGSILDAEMNHLKRSGERTKTTSAGRRLPFLSASRQSLPDDPGCSLQEQTHTTLIAEHPSLQTFSSSSESSILCRWMHWINTVSNLSFPKKRGRRSQKGIEDDFEGDLDSETDEQ